MTGQVNRWLGLVTDCTHVNVSSHDLLVRSLSLADAVAAAVDSRTHTGSYPPSPPQHCAAGKTRERERGALTLNTVFKYDPLTQSKPDFSKR